MKVHLIKKHSIEDYILKNAEAEYLLRFGYPL